MFLDGFGEQLLQGTLVTIYVTLVSIVIGVLLGMLGALCEISKFKLLSTVAKFCTSIIRGIPELLIIFAIYFGGTILISSIWGDFTEINFIAGVCYIRGRKNLLWLWVYQDLMVLGLLFYPRY